MSNALPSHETTVAFRQTPGGRMVDIAEVRDITFPRTSREPFPTGTHKTRLDRYVMGSLRRDVLTFDMNFLNHPTHDHVSGLYHHLIRNIRTDYQIRAGGVTYGYRGNVTGISSRAPVDGLSVVTVRIRLSQPMTFV